MWASRPADFPIPLFDVTEQRYLELTPVHSWAIYLKNSWQGKMLRFQLARNSSKIELASNLQYYLGRRIGEILPQNFAIFQTLQLNLRVILLHQKIQRTNLFLKVVDNSELHVYVLVLQPVQTCCHHHFLQSPLGNNHMFTPSITTRNFLYKRQQVLVMKIRRFIYRQILHVSLIVHRFREFILTVKPVQMAQVTHTHTIF